jgi:hypothetical protein
MHKNDTAEKETRKDDGRDTDDCRPTTAWESREQDDTPPDPGKHRGGVGANGPVCGEPQLEGVTARHFSGERAGAVRQGYRPKFRGFGLHAAFFLGMV